LLRVDYLETAIGGKVSGGFSSCLAGCGEAEGFFALAGETFDLFIFYFINRSL
jgi:hypothetical protein